jgi:hypothetical protein
MVALHAAGRWDIKEHGGVGLNGFKVPSGLRLPVCCPGNTMGVRQIYW